MDIPTIWFNEPKKIDDTFAQQGERTYSWLKRSTNPTAVACRKFLNFNMGKLPPKWQPALYENFQKKNWSDVFFELFVGRTLQILGASIEVEKPLATGRQPDFLATFSNHSLIVEATNKQTNLPMREQMANNERLIPIVEKLLPDNYSIAIFHLPQIPISESKRAFKIQIERAFSLLPTTPDQNDFPLDIEFDHGVFSATIYLRFEGKPKVLVRGATSGMDDTGGNILKAFKNKKRQVRGSETPIILAITMSPFGATMDKFDRDILGMPFIRIGLDHEVLETGFDGSGYFSQNNAEIPTFAAALAFPETGFTPVSDPVLYVNSRFQGKLPEELTQLETRSYQEGVGIVIQESKVPGFLQAMEFVQGI